MKKCSNFEKMPGPLARRKPGRFEVISKGKTTESSIIEIGQKKTADVTPVEPASGGSSGKPPTGGRGTSGPGDGPEGGGPGRPSGMETSLYANQYGIWQQIKQQVATKFGTFKGWWNSRSGAERVAWIIGTLAALGIPGWVLYEWLKRDADVDASNEMQEATTSRRTESTGSSDVMSTQRTEMAVVGNMNGYTQGQSVYTTGTGNDLVHVRDVVALIKALRCNHDCDDEMAIGKLTMEYDVYVRPKRNNNYVGGAQQDW